MVGLPGSSAGVYKEEEITREYRTRALVLVATGVGGGCGVGAVRDNHHHHGQHQKQRKTNRRIIELTVSFAAFTAHVAVGGASSAYAATVVFVAAV